MSTIVTLQKIFDRDLNSLKIEIDSYNNENTIWKTDKTISNSAGNLTLHLIGNLNHFIGTILGNTNYIRNRELEFSTKNTSKFDLIKNIEETKIMISHVLKNLKEDALDDDYPLEVFNTQMTTSYFLIHLTTHLSYHLGQINYHRRLLD